MPRSCWSALFGLTSLLFASCQYEERIRVACVGDSITFGLGVEDWERNNYPHVLEQLLGGRYVVRNFGVSGATLLRKGDMPYVQHRGFRRAREFQPHIVVIKLGTNDIKAENWVHEADYVADYRALVQEFLDLDSRPRVFLCVPVPVYNEPPGGPGDRIKVLKARIEQLGKELNLPVIDLYTALNDRPDLFPDRVHPNAAGARRIAETVHQALMSAEPH